MDGTIRTRRFPLWSIVIPVTVPLAMAGAHFAFSDHINAWLWSEGGPLEMSHILIPLFAAGVGVSTLMRYRGRAKLRHREAGWLTLGLLGLAALCLLIAGEEASWGQHIVGWSTPESWSQINDQQETNLHNVSSWADQKPRAIVELGMILFGIGWPVWHLMSGRSPRSGWTICLPPLLVLPTALMGECVRLLERLSNVIGKSVLTIFQRPSELQEFYFYTFFALTAWAWRSRLVELMAQTEPDSQILPMPVTSPEQPRREAA